ncbi:hypothetical protein AJ80_02060 [Polytolypa hystricis UAMH7299]|uniref:Uncharacterized protein n=1 Tax=Polytolypa hystricis (strain UAMH7299) TaxID=1447883 RepID=A0A2B7YSG9_POLH7|nr:hypothetical protein AJ80_02060 [Polytolypa hystricis UAMH7299]
MNTNPSYNPDPYSVPRESPSVRRTFPEIPEKTKHVDSRASAQSQGNDNRSSGEFSFEDISGRDVDYDADVEIIRPYEYEEAESDGSTPRSTSSARKQMNGDYVWSSGLVDSMNTLHCDSDGEPPTRRQPQKAGGKRKSRNHPSDDYRPMSSPHSTRLEVIDMQERRPEFSPKKIRKRSRRPADADDTSDSLLTVLMSEDSSGGAVRDETSGDDGGSTALQDDQMDLD